MSSVRINFTREVFRKMGAQVTTIRCGQGACQLVVRHRGATVDVWPKSGRWRPRVLGNRLLTPRRDGLEALIAVLTAETLPAWMTRRAA